MTRKRKSDKFKELIEKRRGAPKLGRMSVYMSKLRKAALLIAVACIAASGADSLAEGGKKLSTLVSIQPQAYFLKRIGGGRISVLTLVPPGKNPSTYTPSPWQISEIAKAKVFFRIRVPFEVFFLPKLKSMYKDMLIVDTQEGIKLRKMEDGHHSHHSHEDEDHEDEGGDPHSWLSPVLVKKQAENICRALVRLDPAGKEAYQSNLKAFINDLTLLDNKIRKILSPLKGDSFLTFHPSFGYLADEYHLKQIAVEVEGKAPKAGDMAFLIKKAKREKIRVVFTQSQFDRNAAEKVAAAINGSVVDIDPLSENYIENLEAISEKIAEALKK